MNTYKNLKLIITHTNEQYKNGEITAEEYKIFKTETLKKMDTFLICNRIGSEKYEELYAVLLPDEDGDLTDSEEESV